MELFSRQLASWQCGEVLNPHPCIPEPCISHSKATSTSKMFSYSSTFQLLAMALAKLTMEFTLLLEHIDAEEHLFQQVDAQSLQRNEYTFPA